MALGCWSLLHIKPNAARLLAGAQTEGPSERGQNNMSLIVAPFCYIAPSGRNRSQGSKVVSTVWPASVLTRSFSQRGRPGRRRMLEIGPPCNKAVFDLRATTSWLYLLTPQCTAIVVHTQPNSQRRSALVSAAPPGTHTAWSTSCTRSRCPA